MRIDRTPRGSTGVRKLWPLLAILSLAGQEPAPAERLSKIVAVGAQGAVMMAPPEIASESYVRRFLWTSEGNDLVVERLSVPEGVDARTLLARRQSPDQEGLATLTNRAELVAWNVKSRRSHVLFAFDPNRAKLGYLERVPGGDRLYASLEETTQDTATGAVTKRLSYIVFSASTGSTFRVARSKDATDERLEFSDRGLGALIRSDSRSQTQTVAFLTLGGQLGPTIALPERSYFDFASDGSPTVAVKVPGKARDFIVRRLDPQTGRLGDRIEPTANVETKKSAMRVAEVALQPGGRGITLAYAPRQPGEVAWVTTDGTTPRLSPHEDAVAYLSSGTAFVRRLTKLTPEEYALADRDAQREIAMGHARQVATGLLNYASDNDDALPPSGSSLKETARPYVRDSSVFDGYSTAFGGQLPETGRNVLEIGSIAVLGGKAVVYGDGTVRWVPDGA